MLKRLILILITPLILILFFQNCQKKQSGELSSYEECLNNGGTNCGLVSANGLRLPLDPSLVDINLNSLYAGASAYRISVSNNVVINTISSASCTLNNNVNWQQIKNLYLDYGICEYRFELPPGSVQCMAMAIPYGEISSSVEKKTYQLSTSVCQNDYYSVCGQENQQAFQQAFMNLERQLTSNTACD